MACESGRGFWFCFVCFGIFRLLWADLFELLKLGAAKEPGLSGIEEDCLFLNRFYIDTRYPVHWPVNYTGEVVSEAKNAALNISRMVKKLLE